MIEPATTRAPSDDGAKLNVRQILAARDTRETAVRPRGKNSRGPIIVAAIACAISVLLSASSPSEAYTSAEEFLRSYDANFTARDIVSGQARIARIDHERGLVTLVHEAVRSGDGSLAMPEMSMTLQVADPHWLHDFRPGAIVSFKAARRRGAITVISIEPVVIQNPEK